MPRVPTTVDLPLVIAAEDDTQAALLEGAEQLPVHDLALALLNIAVADEDEQQQQPQQQQQQSLQEQQQQQQQPMAARSLLPAASRRRAQHSTLAAGALYARRQREAPRPAVMTRDDSVVRRKATQPHAGRRRQHRYQNHLFLATLARRMAETSGGGEGEGVDMEAELLRASNLPEAPSTPLDYLFHDWRAMKAWMEFNKLPEAEQHRRLHPSAAAPRRSKPGAAAARRLTPQQRYTRIDRSLRRTLRRSPPPRAFLDTVEAAVSAHFGCGSKAETPAAATVQPLVVERPATEHGLAVLQAVAQYYQLQLQEPAVGAPHAASQLLLALPRDGAYVAPGAPLTTWLRCKA